MQPPEEIAGNEATSMNGMDAPIQDMLKRLSAPSSPAGRDPVGGGAGAGPRGLAITLEEFQRKIMSEKWTGNVTCPAGDESIL